jgi:V/A-type H+-transporting ATPase subunit E
MEEIKQLIDKIQKEGIQAGEEKAQHIEQVAKRRADEIVAKAKKQAEQILAEAQEKIKRTQESANVSIQQSARDVLLRLRTEITQTLKKLITLEIRQSLEPQELAGLITDLVKTYAKQQTSDVVVALGKKDCEKLEQTLLSKMKHEMKKDITLKTDDAIKGGFVISYDKDKSHFDFTDQALAESISAWLEPTVVRLLKEAVGQKKKSKG